MSGLDFKKVLQKPLVAKDDMNPEMSAECVEIVASAVDKYLVAENYEKAAQTCKESLERKYGPTWNVCVGEGFGYDVTYNAKHCLLIYYGAWRLGPFFFFFASRGGGKRRAGSVALLAHTGLAVGCPQARNEVNHQRSERAKGYLTLSLFTPPPLPPGHTPTPPLPSLQAKN